MALPKTWRNVFYPPEKDQYTYFVGAPQHTFPGAESNIKAAWAADAAMLAYGRFGPQPMTEADLNAILDQAGFGRPQLVGNWAAHGSGTQGFFASNDGFAVLAFRGTEKDDLADLISDAAAIPVSETHGVSISGLAHGEIPLVHHGFQKALNDVWDRVDECAGRYRDSHPDAELCCTGHSLGAALATLAIGRIADPNASLYTIGCPRVGNAAFYRQVAARAAGGVHRYVDGSDLVTHVAPASSLYRHPDADWLQIQDVDAGRIAVRQAADAPSALADLRVVAETVRAIGHGGIGLDELAPADLADHSPARYTLALWKNVDLELQPVRS
jgi:hypothetical protein